MKLEKWNPNMCGSRNCMTLLVGPNYINVSAQFRARADEVRGESLQFKRGELIKFRKRGGQKLLSKHAQRVKKTFRAPESFFVPIRVKK